MSKRSVIYFIIIVFCAVGCVSKNKKVFIKKYYPSGKLLSSGWYIKDTIPIDTIFEYYESGKLLSVSVFDSAGKLNGSFTSYYENGKKEEQNFYAHGQLKGFTYQFNKNGRLESKIFSLNGKQIGDYYGYDKNEILHNYAFYWDDTTYVSYLEYDSTGKLKTNQNNRSILFNNRTTIRNIKTDNKLQKDCIVQLVISNPPKCRTRVKIDFISNKDLLIRSDSVENVPVYLSHILMPANIQTIKFSAIQYDSIMGKFYNYKVVTNL